MRQRLTGRQVLKRLAWGALAVVPNALLSVFVVKFYAQQVRDADKSIIGATMGQVAILSWAVFEVAVLVLIGAYEINKRRVAKAN